MISKKYTNNALALTRITDFVMLQLNARQDTNYADSPSPPAKYDTLPSLSVDDSKTPGCPDPAIHSFPPHSNCQYLYVVSLIAMDIAVAVP